MSNIRTIKRGDTWREDVTFNETIPNPEDPEGEGIPGDPIDLTGASLRMHLRDKQLTTVAVLASTDTGEFVVTDAAAGLVSLTVPAATMAEVTPATYSADIEITYPGGVVESSPTFYVTVTPDVTFT